jgi:hypothetical protein
MKQNVPMKKKPVAAKRQAPDIQRRINSGWLKLWRTVWPNTPPPQTVQSLKPKGGTTERLKLRKQKAEIGRGGKVQRPKSKIQRASAWRPAAVDYLSRLICVGCALASLATGCAGPRPLRGGKAVTTHKPAGIVEQTLVQSENPATGSKQNQESVKVRTYTVPAGSRVEQSQTPSAVAAQAAVPAPASAPPSTINSQPSTSFVLSAPMPVVEREETRAGTELGAAQKDTARELGAKLSSLKGIVWVGVGLFVFGLASLVWPPLKVVIGSVTTSAALMLGGLALMVLPSLIVGNELLILGCVGVAVGGWFLAYRHGQLRGTVAASSAPQTPGSSQSGS